MGALVSADPTAELIVVVAPESLEMWRGRLAPEFPRARFSGGGARRHDSVRAGVTTPIDPVAETLDRDTLRVALTLQVFPVAPHRPALRSSLATILGLGVDEVSVKATTTDGLGVLGRGEGPGALAVVLMKGTDDHE